MRASPLLVPSCYSRDPSRQCYIMALCNDCSSLKSFGFWRASSISRIGSQLQKLYIGKLTWVTALHTASTPTQSFMPKSLWTLDLPAHKCMNICIVYGFKMLPLVIIEPLFKSFSCYCWVFFAACSIPQAQKTNPDPWNETMETSTNTPWWVRPSGDLQGLLGKSWKSPVPWRQSGPGSRGEVTSVISPRDTGAV